MDDLKLIKSCIKREAKAQKLLFDKFYHPMYHLAMRFVANHHDSEDVLITAFTKVFDKISSFEYRGENSLKKWIKTIVINESIRFLDQRKVLQLVEDHLVLERELPIENEALAIDTEEVYSIIENMPVGYRTVFNLYAIEGYSHQEIAEMLHVTQSTSKSQLCKARNYIVGKLKNNAYEIPKYG